METRSREMNLTINCEVTGINQVLALIEENKRIAQLYCDNSQKIYDLIYTVGLSLDVRNNPNENNQIL